MGVYFVNQQVILRTLEITAFHPNYIRKYEVHPQPCYDFSCIGICYSFLLAFLEYCLHSITCDQYIYQKKLGLLSQLQHPTYAAPETKGRCFSSTILQADVADPAVKHEAVFYLEATVPGGITKWKVQCH